MRKQFLLFASVENNVTPKEYLELLESDVKTYPHWLEYKSNPKLLWCEISTSENFKNIEEFKTCLFGGRLIEKVESCLGCSTIVFYSDVNPRLFISET